MTSSQNKFQSTIISTISQYPEFVITIIITLGLSILVSQYNLAGTHDGQAHLTWNYLWSQQLLHGDFLPKWNEQVFLGLGSPSFIFYPPLARTLSFPLTLAGLSVNQSLRGLYMMILIINAIGLLVVSRLLLNHKLARCLLVFGGVFNPFLVICIIKRGALAEALAITLVTWIVIGINFILEKNSKISLLPLILAFSALFLTHIPSSVTILSSYVVSIGILLTFQKLKVKKALLLMVIPIFAIFLDAVFTFPVLLDVDLIQSVGSPPYYNRFLLFIDFGKKLLPIFSRAEEGWEKSLFPCFFLGLITLILTTFIARPWKIKNAKDLLLSQQFIMLAFSLFMMTNLSLGVYQSISVFEKIQFPWRFLTVSSSLTPYLLAFSVEKYLYNRPNLPYRFALIAVIAMLSLLNYKSAKLYSINFNDSSILDSLYTYGTEISPQVVNGLKSRKINDDYSYIYTNSRESIFLTSDNHIFYNDVPWSLPSTVPTDNWLNFKIDGKTKMFLPKLYPKIEVIKGVGQIDVETWKPGFRQIKVNNLSDAIVSLKTFYYPGWEIKAISSTGKDINIDVHLSATKDGRMQLHLPPGNYTVQVWYQGTFAERIGIIVSIATWLLIVLLGIFFVRSRKNASKGPQFETLGKGHK
jgi:hypothetical protein